MATATFTCQPPSSFNFADPLEWPMWFRRFQRFRSVSGLVNSTAEEQIDALIYTMGNEAETILHSLQLSDADSIVYEKVSEAFEAHFIGKRNVIYERAKFNSRTQQEAETVDEFITTLHTLARHCNYGSLTDELIRDRIVVGVRDRRLSDKLQMDDSLTLSKAKTMVRLSEKVKNQNSVLNQDPLEEKIERVQMSHRIEQRPKPHEVAPSSSRNTNEIGNRYKRPCNFCGRQAHGRKDCPARKSICNCCRKLGHFAAVCMSRSGIKEVTENKRFEENTAFLGAVTAPLQGQRWMASIQVGQAYISFKIDTGADVNVMPKADFEKYILGIRLHPTKKKLMGPDGAALAVTGMFYEKLRYRKQSVWTSVYVVKNAERALLSGKTSEELGIITRLCAISEKKVPEFDPRIEYPALFKGLGHASSEFHIRLRPDAKPFALSAPRRVPLPLMKKVRDQLDSMVLAGVIVPVTEPTAWCAPMVIIPKKDDKVRICVDLSRLNQFIQRGYHPMPVNDHMLAQIGQAKVFSKLDAYWGFWQFGLAKESQELTTFISPFGRYCFARLPFGITTGPEFFQQKMTELLGDMEGVTVNMDDILVFGETLQEHDQRLRIVLNRLCSNGFTLNPDKCQFRTTSITYLGHLIDEAGIHPSREKIKAVVAMAPPKTVSELKSFLGLVNYHGKFIPGLATQAQPLNELLKRSNSWIWDRPQQTAFENLKMALTSPPVLAKYDPSRETTISADASSYGLGAVLRQRQDQGEDRPIAFASRTLNSTEQRYAQIEKEGLALIWACEKFQEYITGLVINLETDHKPLIPIFTTKSLDDITPRLQRMRLRLMRYDYKIYHTPGKQLLVADALSRKPLEVETSREFSEETVAFLNLVEEGVPVSDKLLQQIKDAQSSDPLCRDLYQYTNTGWPGRKDTPLALRPFWQHRMDISVVHGLLLRDQRLIIPRVLQQDMLERLHEGHMGIVKCRLRARASVWWPGISSAVSALISRCDECAREYVNHREPLVSTRFPTRPWQTVAMDLFYLRNHWYLLVTDYFSRYPEVTLLSSLTTQNVIQHVKSIFARHGIPETVISDNGPQFAASEFRRLARDWGFLHRTSSPRYPQSNGFVESAVRIIKRSMKKEADGHIALLNYRTTPLANGFSPAELLFGRRLRSRVPVASQLLMPQTVDGMKLSSFEAQERQRQGKQYNSHHRALPLSPLTSGQQVWIADLRRQGTIVGLAGSDRSYNIQTDKGSIRRNRVHLVPLLSTTSNETLEEEEEPDQEEEVKEEDHIEEGLKLPDSPLDSIQPQSTKVPQGIITRAGRLVRRPGRLKDYIV